MMILLIALTLLLSLVSAVLYRAGGMSKNPETNPKWIPVWMRHSWMRDWVIPMFSIGSLLLWKLSLFGWMIIPSYILMGAAFSTYWDWVPFNKGKDNFYMHGFFIGLSTFPFIFAGLAWWIPLAQALISGVAMGLWSAIIGNDVAEEMGRGFVSTAVRMIHG